MTVILLTHLLTDKSFRSINQRMRIRYWYNRKRPLTKIDTTELVCSETDIPWQTDASALGVASYFVTTVRVWFYRFPLYLLSNATFPSFIL